MTDERHDAVVIGAGVFGLATALELARRGFSVAAIDRFGSGHPATSSTGASRGIRIAYNEPFYVSLALDAIGRWRQLERATGRDVLHLTGQIDLGPESILDAIVGAVDQAGGRIDQLSPSQMRELMPELAPEPNANGLFHSEGGTVMAEQGLLAMRDAAAAAGVTLHMPERVIAVEPADTITITTDRRTLISGHVVIAAGPWSVGLLDQIGFRVPLAPAVAQVTFLDAPTMVNRPGITEWNLGSAGAYGHPVPGVGYKVALDAGAEGWDADTELWEADLTEQSLLLQWLARRVPGAPPAVKLTQRHPWTMTPDADFVVDRRGPVTVACGCSGHAFKFGPALGPLVADVLEGAPPHPLLALDRAGLQGPASAVAPITR